MPSAGDVVPVGQTIALIFAAGETGPAAAPPAVMPAASAAATGAAPAPPVGDSPGVVRASPLARKIAEQHGVDIAAVQTPSGRIEKADVLAYVERQKASAGNGARAWRRIAAASPKARRLAAERGVDLRVVRGSGPGGAVLAADVPRAAPVPRRRRAAAPAAPASATSGASWPSA